MDALSEILGSFGVSGTLFSQARFGTPWAVSGRKMSCEVFHVIVSGSAHVRLEDSDEFHALAAGDIVVLPHGHSHVLAGDPSTTPVPIRSLPQEQLSASLVQVSYAGKGGGDGRGGCSMLCGTIRFADELGHPLVELLPALIHRRSASMGVAGWLDTTVRVGMSRSSLFSRFTELVGEPPAQYLTNWRMHLAKLELRNDELGLAQIADRVGYASEGAFSKAFKRTIGVSPSEFRMAERPLAAAAG